MAEKDIPAVIALARRVYSVPFADAAAERWLKVAIASPDILALTNWRSAMILNAMRPFWRAYRPRIDLLFAGAEAGRVWDLVRMARIAKKWAVSLGAEEMIFGAETSVDLAALARAVGDAKRAAPVWRVAL